MRSKKLNIVFQPTQRGFLRAEFLDLYGNKASMQKSSLATDDAIWLGSEQATHSIMGKIVDLEKEGYDCSARMHLSRKQVAELIPILQYFVDNGNLPIKRIKPNRPRLGRVPRME